MQNYVVVKFDIVYNRYGHPETSSDLGLDFIFSRMSFNGPSYYKRCIFPFRQDAVERLVLAEENDVYKELRQDGFFRAYESFADETEEFQTSNKNTRPEKKFHIIYMLVRKHFGKWIETGMLELGSAGGEMRTAVKSEAQDSAGP